MISVGASEPDEWRADDVVPATPRVPAADVDLEIRQLRHHTKNTLQRILALIADTPGLHDTPGGQQVARELENRICLSATIANALFGLTETPGPMAERLRHLAGGLVEMMKEPNQVIRAGVSVRGTCPAHLRDTVLRCVQELVGNAVKHGMKGRQSGRISIRLVSDASRTNLTVVDNGWGFKEPAHHGEGLILVGEFVRLHGGRFAIEGEDGAVARVELPHSAD